MDSNINNFIKRCIVEDIGSGDHTSIACIDKDSIGHANLITKEDCVIAGIKLAQKIYNYFDTGINIKTYVEDGEIVKKNTKILSVFGNKQAILASERIILNCMQRMSGIASNTHLFVQKVQYLNVHILDTRKTSPSIRFMDKEAVKIGGGTNHRDGLYDVMMIKDNHIDFCDGIVNAIKKCNEYLLKNSKKLKIIVEVRDFNELEQVLSYGQIDRILLDNFSISNTKKAVQLVNGAYPLESSGNINIQNVKKYALCGVNFISIGTLTHSVKSIDLSMICR